MAGLNWDDFRFFLAVAREQRVSAAGKALGVQHTTVARRIETLETRLGTRLFDRSTEGYAMTQAAENLYDRALVMEEQALAVDREIIGMDAQLKGPLRLTAPHDLLTSMVIPKSISSIGNISTNPPISTKTVAANNICIGRLSIHLCQ